MFEETEMLLHEPLLEFLDKNAAASEQKDIVELVAFTSYGYADAYVQFKQIFKKIKEKGYLVRYLNALVPKINRTKINITQYLSLVNGMSKLARPKLQRFSEKYASDPVAAYEAINGEVADREHELIDNDKVDKEVEKLVEGCSEAEKKFYEAFGIMAGKVEKKFDKTKYRKQKL